MGKYIRTKDGRIGKVTHEDNKNYRAKFGRKCPLVSKADVIKTADNIEELIDEKVAIRKSNHKPYLGHLSGKFIFQEDNGWLGRVDSYEIIYGAIWTDGGLIYVAKMNDKGELELL